MVTFREMFAKGRAITKLGALSFPTSIWHDEQRTPHYEMQKSLELYETRPLVNSGIKQLSRFICGGEISVKSADPKTSEFLNKWVKMRKSFDNEVLNMTVTGLVTGNMFVENTWKETVNHSPIIDNLFNINDSSRVYLNLNTANDNEYWIYEVPIEVRTFPLMGEMKSPKFFKVNYVYGSYLFTKMIWGVGVSKDKISHKKIGWSRDGIYGRSFLASAIDDGEVLREILKNFSVIARYRAIGKKIFSVGNPEDPATLEDVENLEAELKTVKDEDHIIVNKPVKAEPLNFTGENDSMQTQVEFLRKDISSGLVPNYLTPWNAEVNRSTAGETRIPFELEVNSFKSDLIMFLNHLTIDRLRIQYPWLNKDATFTFGIVDMESKEDKMTYASNLYQLNVLTLNELRQMAGISAINGGNVFLKDLPKEDLPDAGIGESATYKEGIDTADVSDTEWLKDLKKNNPEIPKPSTIEKSFDIKGRRIRMLKTPKSFDIYDGVGLLKSFTPEEKKIADVYYSFIKEARKKALDEFYEGTLPEHEVLDEFFEELKRLNAEVISEVFAEIPKSKLKEAYVLNKDMLPKLDGIFDKFNSKVSEIVNNVAEKMFGISVDASILGGDKIADEKTKEEMKYKTDTLKDRMKSQLKTMNNEMKNDVFRHLSDGIVSGKHPTEIKQELKDKYSYYKTKDNPQDWKIDRVVRTELMNSVKMMKLIKWKNMGFKKAEWITTIDEKECEVCRVRNRKVYPIEYLMLHADVRTPHPSCRCGLRAYA